jgi:hypothetical protein
MRRAAVLLFALLSAALGAVSTAAPALEIPFRFTDGFICLEARVPGSAEPLSLILDSGAGKSVLSLRAAKRLKLPLGAALPVRSVAADATAFHLSPLRAEAKGVPLPPIELAVDLSAADELCSHPVDGLIGVEFFCERVVEIDYAHRCLRVSDVRPVTTGANVLQTKMVNDVLCVPISVNGSAPRWTRLDTGCNDALHWVVPRATERTRQKGVSLGFISDFTDTSVTSVGIGSSQATGIKTSLHGRAMFPGEAGLIGNGLLSHYTVTVDWPRQQVLLHEATR